ncbi:MAG: methyltransferase [Oscillospiraceae bacterium]|jgi:tRNA1(Val) A37 N6-methylase TrmN6|nr:methyltransferase [Oscillospiraceae bacterium]
MSELWSGGPEYETCAGAFPLTADSVLLADFARAVPAKSVLDLGCGSGILGLLLAWHDARIRVTGVELDAAAADCARANAENNGLAARTSILTAGIRNCADFLPHGSFDLAVSNPPYFASGVSAARAESTLTLPQLLASAARCIKNGGALCLVYRPERLPELFAQLELAGFTPKRLRLVQHTASSAPSMALVDARRGGKPSLEVLPTLLLKDENGSDSAEIRRIYHI